MASRREERHKINTAIKGMRNGSKLRRLAASLRRVFSFSVDRTYQQLVNVKRKTS
jgi:hypothetical protein